METIKKIKILADSAKYDASCSSSGSTRSSTPGGIGNAAVSGICHSWADDGRCISLLKILFTNYCIYDCAYCINRRTNDIKRASFTVDEIVDLTINFYLRNYIEGLFLSSGILRSPDYTMELLLEVVKKLRIEKKFNGYIHLKAIPGADPDLIYRAGLYADRMSVNIELPSENSLKLLAPEKSKVDIVNPMKRISSNIEASAYERKISKKAPQFVPAGQSTQLIVGATEETDLKIIHLSENLYNKVKLKRVYYSAFVPVTADSRLPAVSKPPLLREHRLYQADWLLRFYNFSADEILDEKNPNLDLDLDPKTSWALRNLHLFPIDINKASWNMLMRVPGIGQVSIRRIWSARKHSKLTFSNLRKMGVVMKRAKYFITVNGKFYESFKFRSEFIKTDLLTRKQKSKKYLLMKHQTLYDL